MKAAPYDRRALDAGAAAETHGADQLLSQNGQRAPNTSFAPCREPIEMRSPDHAGFGAQPERL